MKPDSHSYHRVTTSRIESDGHVPAGDRKPIAMSMAFRWWLLPLSALLCAVQAIITIIACNTAAQFPTSTLITVIGFGILMVIVLAVNPLIALILRGRVRPLGRAELMAVIASLMITAGISTFGLSEVLAPIIATPWNPEWNTPQRGWDVQLHPHLRRELYITDPAAIMLYREGIPGQPAQDAPFGEWMGFYRTVIAQIPWMTWLRPLGWWMIFVLGCYGLFWSLSYLVLDLWSRQEKLIFPLAKLPLALLPPVEGESRSILPEVVRQPLFWLGFAVSFLVLGYNAAAIANWIPLARLPLGLSGSGFNALVSESSFSGLVGGGTWLIIFTCIGIAFLLPLEISFSIWFYFCMGRLLIFIMTRLGHGQNFNDFPSDWTWGQNPITTLGMGGILLFSAVTLYGALRDFIRPTKRDAAPAQRRWLPAAGLAVSFAIVTAWLCWNRLPLGWAIFVTLFLVLITLGLMRIVAESGVFWIQSNAGFFHLYKMLGLGGVFPPVLIAPLIPIYALFFFDIKTFIAPNIINAAKMHEEVGGSRLRFHLNIAISVATSVVVAIGYSIVLAYSRGAQQMNNWFYSNGPRGYFEQAARAATMPFKFEPTTFGWFVAGGAWVALTLILRRTMFWFPHPAGFLMNINPLMQYLWFSFFIGWVCKKITVQYGGKMTFDLVRRLMLGLIFGELIAILLIAAINLLPLGVRITGIDLNRYAP